MHACVCDVIAELVQNSIEAGASRVELDVYAGPDRVDVRVSDNGKGMDAETMAKAAEPFYSEAGKHDGRRVGLGLPFLYQTAEAAGGSVDLRSAPGRGTTVRFTLDAAHVDAPPLGDLPAALVSLLAFEGDYDLALTRRAPGGGYAVTRAELAEALGGLREAACLSLAKAYLASQEAALTDSQTTTL